MGLDVLYDIFFSSFINTKLHLELIHDFIFYIPGYMSVEAFPKMHIQFFFDICIKCISWYPDTEYKEPYLAYCEISIII